MYNHVPPTPIVIPLIDEDGKLLRQKAADFIAINLNKTGAERGSVEEQGFGVLAEMVIRSKLGMPLLAPSDQSLGFDILLPNGVRADVKCRGGMLPFQEQYLGNDGLYREAKHNFFARQVYDENTESDIYIMTHLRTPADRTLPGRPRQRNWVLYICGWVSKARVIREGVYLPRGSLTEQGNTWFTYRGQQVEFYNRNLNGLKKLEDLTTIDNKDVDKDKAALGQPNLTSVDIVRISYDLVGRGILSHQQLDTLIAALNINGTVKPILHANQYFHLLKWLDEKGNISEDQMALARKLLPEQPYTGI